MAKKSKETMIKREYKKLLELFSGLPENERKFLDPQLQNAAFMKITLDELQQKINANGTQDEYQNGANQHGVKISADLQSYNQTVKSYNTLMDKLLAKLPAVKAGRFGDMDD